MTNEEKLNRYEHWWYTVDHGFGIKCAKCGKYANMLYDSDFVEIEKSRDCSIPDGENTDSEFK